MDLRRVKTAVFPKTLLHSIAQAGMGFFLASGVVFGEYAPLGLGYIAAAGRGALGLSGILGAVLGYLCVLYRANGLKYLAVTALILTERIVFREQGLKASWLMPAASALATALLGFVFLLDGGVHLEECIFFLCEVLLVFGSAWLYQTARTHGHLALPPLQKQSFLVCLVATWVIPLLRVELVSNLSLGRALSHAAVMVAGWFGGAEFGGIASVILGVTCGSVYCAVYGVATLISTALRKRGSIGFLCGHLVTSLLAMLVTRRYGLGVETIVASVVFTIVRLRFSPLLREIFQADAPIRSATKTSLRAAANAFSALGEMLTKLIAKPHTEDIACVFSRPARMVCKTCPRADVCWKSESAETKRVLTEMGAVMRETHALKATDLPLEFSTRCLHLGDFVAEVNRELPLFFCRKEYKTRLAESNKRLCAQYREVSRVLNEIAEEHPPRIQAFRASLGVAKKRKQGTRACGDTVGHCRTPNGTVCVLLADGMGTGDGAAKESRLAVELLIRFLECGVDPQSSLAVLSSAMQVKCEETHAFTTLDLLCVDLSDGLCTLYRFGSAPAYFCTNDAIECVPCTAMPLGLSCTGAPSVERVTRTLKVGDRVILMSDGVEDSIKPQWLMDILRENTSHTPQELAKEILLGSQSTDDRTVLVFQICEE